MAPPAAEKIALATSPATGSRFDWPLAYDGETVLRNRLEQFFERNSFSRHLAHRMASDTGTDYFEWIDHFILPQKDEAALRKAGFTEDASEAPPDELVLHYPNSSLPRVR